MVGRLLLFFVDVIGGCGLVCKLFMNYLLNNCFYFCRQVKFRRGSNKKAGRQAKKWAGSMKKCGEKNIWRPRLKKKKYGAQTLIVPPRAVQ